MVHVTCCVCGLPSSKPWAKTCGAEACRVALRRESARKRREERKAAAADPKERLYKCPACKALKPLGEMTRDRGALWGVANCLECNRQNAEAQRAQRTRQEKERLNAKNRERWAHTPRERREQRNARRRELYDKYGKLGMQRALQAGAALRESLGG